MQSEMPADQILDQMHHAILAADFAALGQLTPQLETALAMNMPGNSTDLNTLQRKAERNSACLLAAGRGVRSALRRLAEVQGAGAGLITYDGSGKRADHATTGQMARRY